LPRLILLSHHPMLIGKQEQMQLICAKVGEEKS
jgi:hypothetical protein